MSEERLAAAASEVDRELRAVPASQDELGERLAALDLGLPGDPWARWLLLALCRHQARQAWVGEVVRERLGGDLHDIGRAGGFGHPDGEQRGQVPGMPGWKYFFHGIGCCLSRKGGEEVDVDFVDGGTEWIDPYFYQSYLESVADGPRAERGLVCDEPYDSGWMTDIASLRDLCWVEGDHKVRLTPLGRELGELLGAAGADLCKSAPEVAAVSETAVGRIPDTRPHANYPRE